VFGLVMMLTTWTWRPPIWLAMLPQKFSAATIWITEPPPPDPAPPAAVLQAARNVQPAARTTSGRRGKGEHLTVLAPRISGEPGCCSRKLHENRFHFK